MIVDTHTHIYYISGEGYNYADDLDEVIGRAQEAGVSHILLPNVDLESYPQMMSLADNYPEVCHPMLGLHPCDVGADYEEVLDALEVKLKDNPSRYIGIGEIGLDYYWDLTYKKEMHAALRRQIGWAIAHDLPVSVHSRDAEGDVIRILSEYPGLRGVVHAFGGSAEELASVISHLGNFMVGIGGTITFKKNPLREIIREQLPLERIVIETDAPYLAPVPHRGRRNEPAYLRYVVAELAQLYGMDEQTVENRIFENSVNLFNLVR